MALTHLADARTAGEPYPAEVITTTLNGVTFRAGRRTAAHLIWTDEVLRGGGMWLRVIQPCYNLGVAASAGTHDGDGCLDVEVMNTDWDQGAHLLRGLGWAAWHRTPPAFSHHIHMVSLGCPGPVGEFVPGQVDDYYRHALGLKGQHDSGDDPAWHPADIDSTVFDYPAWTEEQPMNDADKKWLSDLIDAKLAANNTTLVKAVWDASVTKASAAGVAARAALRKAAGL